MRFKACVAAVLCVTTLAACEGKPVKRSPASPQLEPTIEQLSKYLLRQRKEGAYWSAPFTSDVTSDALILALGKKLGKMNPDLANTYAESMAARMTDAVHGAGDGWPAYSGGPADFNVTAIALLCLEYTGFDKDARFQKAIAWFNHEGGMKKVNKGSDQIYVRLMLGPLDLIKKRYDPMMTPKVFGTGGGFPMHLDRDGFMRGLVVPSIGIRYLEKLPAHALAEYPATADVWKSKIPEIGDGSAGADKNIGRRKCHVPEGDLDHFLETVVTDPKYKDCVFYPQGPGTGFAKRLIRFFKEPITDHLIGALNFIIGHSVAGTQAFWAEQSLILELQLLNPHAAWYTVGFSMCGMRMLQEAHRTGLGDFQTQIDEAWTALQEQMRVPNQDQQLIQQWVLTGTWDTASTLVAFEPLRGTKWGLSDDDVAPSVKWLLAHSVRDGGTRGWSFDQTDSTLPDVDDTALVLAALSIYQPDSDPSKKEMIGEAVKWLKGRQNSDGGYPAWATSMSKFLVKLLGSKGERKEMFSVLADFSQPDVTGRVMYAFTRAGHPGGDVDGVINQSQKTSCAFLMDHMDEMKEPKLKLSAGNWMVNYVYSAASVLNGLVSAGCGEKKQAELANFILATQQTEGGWGEEPTGYAAASYVRGTPTTMQTAVAVAGLIAYYEALTHAPDSAPPVPPGLVLAIEKGIGFLIENTDAGKHPVDSQFNGVLIRGVTFARYELAPAYLALYALGRWEKLRPTN